MELTTAERKAVVEFTALACAEEMPVRNTSTLPILQHVDDYWEKARYMVGKPLSNSLWHELVFLLTDWLSFDRNPYAWMHEEGYEDFTQEDIDNERHEFNVSIGGLIDSLVA